MERQAMIDFAQRMMHAPDNDTRARAIVDLAPDSALSRMGLARQSSTMGTVLAYTGAIAFGAIVGAGAALLLAPTSGDELQKKLRKQAKRISKDVKKATDQVEEAVMEVREQVSAFAHPDAPHTSKRHTAHA